MGTKFCDGVPFAGRFLTLFAVCRTFGELNAVRLPQKMAGVGTGSHRGFAFVEFTTRQDAKVSPLWLPEHRWWRQMVTTNLLSGLPSVVDSRARH